MSHPLLVAGLIVFAQVGNPDLERTIGELRERADAPVARGLGPLAVEAVAARPDMTPEDLELHLAVATRDGAFQALAPLLGRLLARDGVGVEPALRAVAALDPAARRVVVDALGPAAARQRLVDACYADDEGVARGAVAVVLPAASGQVTEDLLRGLMDVGRDRAAWALDVLAACAASPERLEALLRVDPELRELHARVAVALAAALDRAPALAGTVLEAVRREPSPATLGALVATPPERWDEAMQVVMELIVGLADDLSGLRPDEVQLLAAALDAGGELRAPELLELPALADLCRPEAPRPVRLAALRALGDLGAREASIIDLLLTYIDEPGEVGTTAYAALRLRSGARLPHRPLSWRDWRRRTPLTDMTPEQRQERLAAERRNRYELRTTSVAGN